MNASVEMDIFALVRIAHRGPAKVQHMPKLSVAPEARIRSDAVRRVPGDRFEVDIVRPDQRIGCRRADGGRGVIVTRTGLSKIGRASCRERV